MILKRSIFLITIFLFTVVISYSQRNVPSYFGIQVKPIFPTRFIGEPTLTLDEGEFSTTITQKTGFSFGGTVRAGITNLLSLETGINFNQRHFDIDMSVVDSAVYAKNDLTFVSYDIPINGLVYVQLSDNIFMNASLGVALTFKPTHVGIVTNPGGSFSFTHTGLVNRKTGFDLNANFGFEYRTKRSGFFYLGVTARVPFNPIFDLIAQYKYQGYKVNTRGEVDGSFLTIDFKYFFPNIKNSGTQFQNGPIE
jgi:hypothetical protein